MAGRSYCTAFQRFLQEEDDESEVTSSVPDVASRAYAHASLKETDVDDDSSTTANEECASYTTPTSSSLKRPSSFGLSTNESQSTTSKRHRLCDRLTCLSEATMRK